MGEPLVWLSASGLAIGVAMVLGLLILILVQGGKAFWPDRINLVEISRDGTTWRVAGHITQERERRNHDGTIDNEVQIYRGNKDLYGEAFVFVDRNQVVEITQPDSLLLIERMEFGSAIVEAVAIKLPDSRIEASNDDYGKTLKMLLEVGRSSRLEISRIERGKIGAINREMQSLVQAERANQTTPELAAQRRSELQVEFERLKASADKVREKAARLVFVGRSVDGRMVEVPALEMVSVFAANQAGHTGRIAEMFRRIVRFVSDEPREANTDGGVFPAIFGTVAMTLAMSLFVTPFGVMAAIYLREYATQGLLVRTVRICVNNLAGVPSIVFGVFGLAFFVYFVGKRIDLHFFAFSDGPTYGTPGILWASLTLAILTLPVVIVTTEEAISAVPRSMREAALACGASKWQTIQRVVLPASLPGILTGVILAMARGAGEVAPLMLVGVVKLAPTLAIDNVAPFIHPERKFMHLGFHIYDLGLQSPDSEAAKPMVYATALLLIAVVVSLNLAAILIRNRVKKRFAVNSF
jgi:phosphate transport system permease protein